MKGKLMKLGLSILLFLMACVSVQADPSRYVLEQNLTTVAQNVLDSMYGPGNFVAKVSVKMSNPRLDLKHTTKAKAGGSSQAAVAMPPGLQTLGISPDAFNQVPYDSVTYVNAPEVKRVLVSVLANKSYPRGSANRAEEVLMKILNLNPSRGDKVEMTFQKFYFDPQESKQKIEISTTGEEKLGSYQNIFYVSILVLLIIFLIVYVLMQLKHSNILKEVSTSKTDSGGANVNVNSSLELPDGMGGGSGPGGKISMSGGPSIKQYFDFIDESNVDNLLFLLKKEKIKADYVAMIVSFVSPSVGAKIVKELDITEKTVVAAQLLDQKLGSRELLDKLEKKLKTALECFVGGAHTFQGVFDLISGDEKREIMEALESSDEEAYHKFRNQVIIFDDLVHLEDEEIEYIVSDINLEMLATALIPVDQELYQRFDDNLQKSAKDMISQFLELKGESTSRKEVEKAQDSIIKMIKRLELSGKVNLTSKLKSE